MQQKRQQQQSLAVKLALLLMHVLHTAAATVMHLCSRNLLLSQPLLKLSSCRLPKSCHLRTTAAAAAATVQMRQPQGLVRQHSVPQQQQQQQLVLQQALVRWALQMLPLTAVQLPMLRQVIRLTMQDSAAVEVSLKHTQSQMLMQQQ
jgi:hypothetical protein